MRKVRFGDQGKIECRAENIFGTQVARVKLFVFGPPRFSITLPGKVIGFLGKTTKLLCDVVGFPTPVVKWNRSPAIPLPQVRSSLTKGSLIIENTKSDDEGVYICTARNEHGTVIHGTFLKVESVVPPEFSTTLTSSISVPGIRETLRINCSAKGSPLPTVTWYKDDVDAIHAINSVSNDEYTSELVINNFQPEDQGIYRCVARNKYNDTITTNSTVFLPNCGNPVNIDNAMIMKSKNWAGEFVRYLCHAGYTMIGPAVRRCLPNGKWSGENTSCTDRLECLHHTIIHDDTRRVGYEDSSHKCDNNLVEGWYRFPKGRQMNTNCAKYHSCDTERAGWLVGGHPSAEDGRVTKKICFGRTAPSCTCAYHNYIQVRNCGSFYVYKLKPITICTNNLVASRYCTN
ncbi:roundabout homolog 1-like [Stylophora pistillata]|uniref:roundabout homolog 1-like n=1 Tax=Stylophora pistillata TaxID=50429 RepID=UPI000C03F879|nr:roundabout homolog 1-like [Stylophora pistillata]